MNGCFHMNGAYGTMTTLQCTTDFKEQHLDESSPVSAFRECIAMFISNFPRP